VRRLWLTAVAAVTVLGLGGLWRMAVAADPPSAVERLRVKVLRVLPHDRDAFTQGLVVVDGWLYESTGQHGDSRVRRIDLSTGDVRTEAWLPSDLFGEGIAPVGDRLVQLTWREQRALLWSLPDLHSQGELGYQGEGWGLTSDGDRLIMSDGSDVLTLRDPETFAPVGRVPVTLRGAPQQSLNELEWARGAVWANVWGSDSILRIDLASGKVTGVVDAAGLLDPADREGADVLNGIAWNPANGHFLITGKLWPKLFEVEFVPAD